MFQNKTLRLKLNFIFVSLIKDAKGFAQMMHQNTSPEAHVQLLRMRYAEKVVPFFGATHVGREGLIVAVRSCYIFALWGTWAGVVFESVPHENQSRTVSNRQMPI